jgi:predicted pyridoxine 5'-phosphate oxidase superfamily flavin-nucleotide-binding protein
MAIRNFTDLAYSKSVKAMQQHLGTRDRNAELEREPRNTEVTETLSAYLAERTSILLGTAAKSGWPYVQHRGGPKGFVHTLDQHTLAFADYPGNKQYITLGNLAENPKATILAIDHVQRQRVKIWGEAALVEDDRDLLDSLMPEGSAVYLTRAIRFRVLAWDINCPSHIPQLFTLEEVEAASTAMLARIAELEAQMAERG